MAKEKEKPEKKYKTGLCCGKFWPLHSGHQRLIETTIELCEKPVCFLVYRDWERPNVNARRIWIEDLYHDQGLRIHTVLDPAVDQLEPQQRSEWWAKFTLKELGTAPDVVFTSEEYGTRWADHLSCEHVLLDAERKDNPVSGTLVRRDPKLFWSMLPEPVQKWYEENWEELEKYESPADFHIRYPSS